MWRSSTFIDAPVEPFDSGRKWGKGSPFPHFEYYLLGNALAFHALKQLRQVPDLGIGSRCTISQVGRPVLQVDRAGPQVKAASHLRDERIQLGGGVGAQALALLKANGARVRIVDVFPIRSIPLEVFLPAAVHGLLDGLDIRRTPVEVRHAQADLRSNAAVGLVVVCHSPGLLSGSLHLLGL